MKSLKVFFTLGVFVALVLGTSSCTVMNAMVEAASAMGVTVGDDTLAAVEASTAAVAEASAPITPEQEYYIGRSVTASLLGSYKVYNNPALTDYVNKVCKTLSLNSERPELYKGYFVAILDSDQINAFASSGGHILVTRGLLQCATSEDALAAVLAHEIAHIQLQHGIKAIKGDRWTGAALTVASSTASALTDGEMDEVLDAFNESVDSIVTTMVNTGYSQYQEYEADAIALEIMAATGYNPHAMTEMLEQLKVQQPKSSGGFASTHPSADSRLREVNKELKNYTVVTVPQIRQERYAQIMSLL